MIDSQWVKDHGHKLILAANADAAFCVACHFLFDNKRVSDEDLAQDDLLDDGKRRWDCRPKSK